MRGNRELASLEWVKEVVASKGWTATESPDKYDHYDLKIEEIDCLIEVKQRMLNRETFKRYNKEGFMLENLKYNFLRGKRSLYCNTVDFGDCVICMF